MSSDTLSMLRRIIDRQSPPRRRISALILFHSQRIQSLLNKNAACISLTSRHACIWMEESAKCSFNNSTAETSPVPAGRSRRRSSTSSSLLADYQQSMIDPEWPTGLADWIHRKLNQSVQQLIGIDFRWIPHSTCQKLQDELDRLGEHRLVDACQTLDRACPVRYSSNSDSAVFPLTGFSSYAQKVKERIVRCWPCERLNDIEWFVITAVDEICWLFDLKDIPNSRTSAILGPCPKLFIDQKPSKLLNDAFAREAGGLIVRPNDEALSWMADLCGRVAVSDQASESIYRALQSSKCVITNYSPVAQAMSQRSQEERDAVQDLFERDSAAVCCFLHKANGHPNVKNLTDQRSRFDDFRSDQTHIRHLPSKRYMIRSKSTYSNGICLFSRMIIRSNTLQEIQRSSYTLSVRAFLRLLNTQFPSGKTSGSQLDAMVVRYLYWSEGIDPPNETGRAVGLHAMLNSPVIGSNASDHIIEVGNVLKFDCGLVDSAVESCVLVVNADEIPTTTNSDEQNRGQHGLHSSTTAGSVDQLSLTGGVEWLRCRPLTLIPFDANTLELGEFSKIEIDYLNEYNSLCYEILFERIQALSQSDSCIWLKSLARPIGE